MAQKNSAPHRDAESNESVGVSIPCLHHDGPLWIAAADSATSMQWRSGEVSLSRLYARLAQVARTGTKGGTGGYLLGRLSGPRRVAEAVMYRHGAVLDYDHCRNVDELWQTVQTLGCSACLHTTHRHTPESPRCRVIIPTRRTIPPDEYVRVSRAVADRLGLDGLDPSSHEPSRMMYWPTAPDAAEYICRLQDAPLLDPDAYLSGTAAPTQRTWRMGADDADARTAELRRISQGVGHGERNQAAARMTGYLLAHLPDPDIAVAMIEAWSLTCDPPMDPRELHTVIRSIARRQAQREVARHGA